MSHDVFDAAAQAYVDSVGDEIDYEGSTIRAVFAAGFRSVASGDVRLGSKLARLEVRLADLPDGALALEDPPVGGDLVKVDGREFEVATVQPDTEGVSAKLILKVC